MKKDYVQEAIDKGKLVRDQIANVKALVEGAGESISDEDAKWFVPAFKKGNATAVATAEAINQKEAERRRQQELEFLEKRRPLDIINKAIDDLQKDIDEWADKLKADPFHELSWSRGAFEDAAKLRVYKEIQRWLTDNENAERWADIMEDIRDRALSMASAPASSTSPTSNYAETMEMKVRATIARRQDFVTVDINHWFRRHAELTKEG